MLRHVLQKECAIKMNVASQSNETVQLVANEVLNGTQKYFLRLHSMI